MIRKMISLASLAILLGSTAYSQVHEYPWQVGRQAAPTTQVVLTATGLPDGPTPIAMCDAQGNTITVIEGKVRNGLVLVAIPDRYRGCKMVAEGRILRRRS